MPTSPRRPAKKGGSVTKPKAANVKRYEIKPLRWEKQKDKDHYRADSVLGTLDLKGIHWSYFLRIAGDNAGQFGCVDHVGAKKAAFGVYQQQLRRALREVRT